MVLVSKLIDGKFPDYERVVPQTLKNHMTASRQLLLQAMNRAAILTNEKFRGVRVVLAEGKSQVDRRQCRAGRSPGRNRSPVQRRSLDVGFNVGYLLDVLNNVQNDEVVWSFNDANSSALVTVPGNDRFKYVVMPMRI